MAVTNPANSKYIDALSTMSASVSSSDISLFNQTGFSAQLSFSSSFANGAATGSYKLQTSDISGTWSDYPDSGVTITGVSIHTWNVRDIYARQARIVGTQTTIFTGSVSAWVTKKG